MKLLALPVSILAIFGSALAFAASPGAPASPAPAAAAAAHAPASAPAPRQATPPPIMSQRSQVAAVRYAMKQELGITGVKGLKVSLDGKPNAFQAWVGFHAEGAEGAHGEKVSVAGNIDPFKGRLTNDVGQSEPHAQGLSLLATASAPTKVQAGPIPAGGTAPTVAKDPSHQLNAWAATKTTMSSGMRAMIRRAPASDAGFGAPITLNGKVVQVKDVGDGSFYVKGLGMGNIFKGADGNPLFRNPLTGKEVPLGLKK